MTKRNKNLTSGNIKKQLFSLTWPMFFGMMGIVIFNLVDTFFIGKLGVKQLAAIGFCFPVMMLVHALSRGLGIGTSSLISRNIITEKRDNVRRMASRALLLAVIIVIIFVGVGLYTIIPLFTLIGAKNQVLKYIYNYMSIWYLGVPVLIVPMIGNNIVRALGDTFLPGMLMVTSAVVNLILDPLLIFGVGPFPILGIKGAALSTVISRNVSLIFILIILIKKENILTIKLGKLKNIIFTWKKVFYIAIPASIGVLITPISLGLITKILAGFGDEAVAAFGIASRVEMFVLMVISSLGTVLIIFMGQNISKQKFDRIFKSLNYSLRFSLSWGGLVFFILLTFGQEIASVFTNDAKVIEITSYYFLIVGASYGFQGLLMLSNAVFNGINKPYPAALFSITRMLGLYIPLALVGASLFGIYGVFWAGFVANIIIGILSYFFVFKTVRKIRS